MSASTSRLKKPISKNLTAALIQPPPLRSGPAVETFRLLALNLQRLLGSEDRRAIAVLSAWPGDGRSLVATSVARALAELMPPVLLVDADPLGSGVEELMADSLWDLNGNGHSGSRTLGNYPVNQVGGNSNLRVLVPPRRWTTVPRSPVVFVEELNHAIDLAMAEGITVVVDTPPCTTSSIPFYIAGMATGALYVARRRIQDSRTHRDVRAQLDMLNTRILGVVFNEG